MFRYCGRPSHPWAVLRKLAIVPAMTRFRALPRGTRNTLEKRNIHVRRVYLSHMGFPSSEPVDHLPKLLAHACVGRPVLEVLADPINGARHPVDLVLIGLAEMGVRLGLL